MIDNELLRIILIESVFLIAFLLTIAIIVYMRKTGAPVRTTIVQLIGLLFFIPLILALALFDKIDISVISALLGVFVGYVFGKSSLKEEWTDTKQG